MRTTVRYNVRKSTDAEAGEGAKARESQASSLPFAVILAEAEAVQDLVRLSGRIPDAGIGSDAWRGAWEGLCRGVGRAFGTEARVPLVARRGMRWTNR